MILDGGRMMLDDGWWMMDFGLKKIKRRKERKEHRGMIKEKRLNDF